MGSTDAPDHIEFADSTFDFESLVGGEFDFYGVDTQCFKLDDAVYEAADVDYDGGGGSALGCVEESDAKGKIFFAMPVARVVLEHNNAGDEDTYRLIDLHDGHEWLRFGTENYDEWYPLFVFEYTPKAPQD